MVVKIRLQRMGLRNLPFYRIVVANSRAPRDGKFLERVKPSFRLDLITSHRWEVIIQLQRKMGSKKLQQTLSV
jgi:hypothetical protein